MTSHRLTGEECLARYPRLIRSMQWTAILSRGEASCALRDYRDGRSALAGVDPYHDVRRPNVESIGGNALREWGAMMLVAGGGEAVCHFGGPRRVIEHAIRCRHVALSLAAIQAGNNLFPVLKLADDAARAAR